MQFLVLGVDGPEFGADLETDVHERHCHVASDVAVQRWRRGGRDQA